MRPGLVGWPLIGPARVSGSEPTPAAGRGGVVASMALPWGDIPQALRSAGAAAPLVSVGLMTLHTLVPFPSEVVTIANGVVFGPWLGFALSWVGAMVGAYLGFAIARFGGRPLVRRIAGAERLARLDRLVDGRGVWGLLALRLIPVVSFDLVNLAAGLLAIDLWTFSWTTAIGIVPVTAAMVWLGRAIVQGGVLLIWTLAVLAIGAVAGVVLHYRRGGRMRGYGGLPKGKQ